jgi:hypothetical protein
MVSRPMSAGATGGLAVLSPDELSKIAEETEMAEMRATVAKLHKEEEDNKRMRETFMAEQVTPEAINRVMASLRRAAEAGKRELMIGQFPSTFCSDGGRAINNLEQDWPQTLQGIAKRGYDCYEALFKPKGYKMRAQILNYPAGLLGDVGIFLLW